MRHRFLHAPTGIVAEAEELDRDDNIDLDGYNFTVFGGHDANLRLMVAKLRKRVAEGIARTFLTRESGRLLLKEHEVEGRLVWDPNSYVHTGLPFAVIVDGRRLTWKEFGLTFEPYECWRFKLSIINMDEIAPRSTEKNA